MNSDILIIGGGVIGLAIAIELKLRSNKVTVVSRDFHAAATHAAAGMLAPDAEKIPDSAMLELCRRSRCLYPDWTRKLEEFTGINTGYLPCGILAPVYESEELGGASAVGGFPDLRHLAFRSEELGGASAVGGFPDLRHLAFRSEELGIFLPSPPPPLSSISTPRTPHQYPEKDATPTAHLVSIKSGGKSIQPKGDSL